jgi:hypothetical protein
LKTIRAKIKELFEEHSEGIDSPYDALERLGKQLLSDYGVEIGNIEETYICNTIKNERLDTYGQVSSACSPVEVLYRVGIASAHAKRTTWKPTLSSLQWHWLHPPSPPTDRENQSCHGYKTG